MQILEKPPKLYNVKVSDQAELAGAFLENKKTDDIRKRINPFDLVNVRINPEAPFAKAEEEATKNLLELLKNYPLVIWFSPPDEVVYLEGRINIGRTVKNDKGETRIQAKGIPIKWSADEMFGVAKKIVDGGGTPMDEFFDAEGMRKQPIGIDTGGANWIDKCEELMPELGLIWDHIRLGKDEKQKKEMTEIVVRVLRKTGYDNVAFEREMANQGQVITGGNHGGTYTSGERGAGIIIMKTADGQISYRVGSTEGMTLCNNCGCWYAGDVCPCIKK